MSDNERLNLPFTGISSFGKVPVETDLDSLDADVAIIGFPYDLGTQYRSGARFGPKGIRDGSALCLMSPNYAYDHETNEDYFGPGWRIVDCGDIDMVHGDLERCFTNAREFIRTVVSRGAMPVTLGGDHSITIPVLEALSESEPFGIIQFDAHLDFVDERHGQKNGQGSPMRRAAEMDHVTGMAQLGIRGTGSSGKQDFEDARAYGSVILSTAQIRKMGIASTLRMIPKCSRYYVTFDIDGMDASIAPGTGTPSPGGFTYLEAQELLKGIAALGEIVGFDITEVAPIYDPTEVTSQLAARIVTDFIGFILKQREGAPDG